MGKNTTEDAVVISMTDYGEQHRMVCLYTCSHGPVSAVIYGGRKGKKASCAPLFSYGHYVLSQSSKGGCPTLSEEDTVFTPVQIKQELRKTYIASYFSETAQRLQTQDTSCMFELLVSALTELEECLHDDTKILCDYTWALIKLCGIAPDLIHCPSCDKIYSDNEKLGFSSALCCPVCNTCSDTPETVLLPGIRRYLRYTSEMTFEQALDVQIYPQSQERLKSYLIRYISFFCQYPLKTITSGML